jgi:hypothetical protein
VIWWWRARALSVVTIGFLGSLLAGIVIGTEVLPLPSLASALLVPVVFAFLLPLVPTVALWHGVDRSVGGLVRWWAWPIAEARDGLAFAEAVLLFMIGHAVGGRRTFHG